MKVDGRHTRTVWVESDGVPGRGSTFYVTIRTRGYSERARE